MKKFFVLGVVTLITFIFANNLYSQANTVKLGIVDAETILKEMPEFQAADKQVREVGQKWSDTLNILREDLKKKFEVYQKQSSMMAPDQKAKEEESLQAMNMQMMQFQEEKFGQNGALDKLRVKLLEPIREKARKAIEEVAKEEKITLVVDKLTAVYSDAKIDITFKVIDKIKRGN